MSSKKRGHNNSNINATALRRGRLEQRSVAEEDRQYAEAEQVLEFRTERPNGPWGDGGLGGVRDPKIDNFAKPTDSRQLDA